MFKIFFMINKVTNVFTSLSDSEISQVLKEMKEDDSLGIIRNDGLFRVISKRIIDITNESFSSTILLVQIGIYKEAAYRFSGI